jgi:asparagine N-glycosylation enzyme membrane subunit Stt3
MVKKRINELKKNAAPAINFLTQKKVQNILVILLLIATLFIGVSVRLQTLPNLIDSTTGDYIPLALDPYYFMRISETLVENNGLLPGIDEFRSPHLNVSWSKEILPQSTFLIYNVMKIFNSETTISLATVLNPVIFFALGLIVFFFLIWLLSKSKWIALGSTFILGIIPPYLYRTLTGFADHEAIGMFGFFLALLGFSYGIKLLSKKNKPWKVGLIGAISGFLTMFAIVSWGGGAKFLFMILPLAFLINWILEKKEKKRNSLLFYCFWFVFVLVGSLIFSYNLDTLIRAYLVSSTGLITLFTLGYILVDYYLGRFKFFDNIKLLKKYKILSTSAIVIFFGLIIYQIFIGNSFSLIEQIFSKIINPFGTGRVGLTVAENKQPYLSDFIGQIGQTVFWLFLAGCAIVGGKLASGISVKKFRPLFVGSFILFLAGILFTRLSASSVLNGVNFISKALFFISFLILVIASVYISRKSEWKINHRWILIAAWMIPMLLGVRSAIRVFFAIVPFISFMAVFTIFEIGKFAKNNKDEMKKIFSWVLLIVSVIGILVASQGYYSSIDSQAKYQTPSYNQDWQKAMSWVRENTNEGAVFLHWWDYGYWVQTGGNRPTVTDGGHSQTTFGDHFVGRYVLTTPYPETAKSFMKTHEVSYLLIDPTDIGKYGAYSSIGTGKDSDDRSSWIPTLISNLAEIQETKDGIIRIYQGGSALDDDLIYEEDSTEVFLPKGKAAIGAIIIQIKQINVGNQSISIANQPEGIYVYNGQQYRLPIRYLYQNGNLQDFGKGVNATAYLYANVVDQQFDVGGAAMYLSEKTKDSLVAKLYLMDDPDNEYPELELSHTEGTYPFPFYYGGFRGPMKIWEVGLEEMDNILTHEEFLKTSGEYGELDDFQFIK